MSTPTNTVEITKGEDKVLILRIRDVNTDPFDLTALSGAEATFKGATADVVKTLGAGVTVNGDPLLGKINITLDEADTAALKSGTNQDFKIKLELGADTYIKKLTRVLNVIDPSL
jgi:hypothetical protein